MAPCDRSRGMEEEAGREGGRGEEGGRREGEGGPMEVEEGEEVKGE